MSRFPEKTPVEQQIEALTREILSVAINAKTSSSIAMGAFLSAYLNVAKAAGVLAHVPSGLAAFAQHPAIAAATHTAVSPNPNHIH